MPNPYPSETGCCPRFDPAGWDEQEFTWQDKLFIKDKVFCFLHIPLNFGQVIVRNMKKIEAAQTFSPQPPLVLSDYTSAWHMDLYLETTHEIPGAENVRLSGTYLSRVFEGPYQETGKWCRQMSEWVTGKGKHVQKMLTYYTTCPKCAKHYGKNHVVILAQIDG